MPLLLLFRPKRHIMCRFGRLLRYFLVSYRGKLTLPLLFPKNQRLCLCFLGVLAPLCGFCAVSLFHIRVRSCRCSTSRRAFWFAAFLSKNTASLYRLPLLFPQNQRLCLRFWGIPVPLCGFCSSFCKKARSARLFACKRTH